MFDDLAKKHFRAVYGNTHTTLTEMVLPAIETELSLKQRTNLV